MSKWFGKMFLSFRSWFVSEDNASTNKVEVGVSDKLISIQAVDEKDGMVSDWYHDVGARGAFKQ